MWLEVKGIFSAAEMLVRSLKKSVKQSWNLTDILVIRMRTFCGLISLPSYESSEAVRKNQLYYMTKNQYIFYEE